jgi:hypothetical protein
MLYLTETAAVNEAVEAGAVAALVRVIQMPQLQASHELIAVACECLGQLTFDERCKREVIDTPTNAVASLVQLCGSPNAAVAAAAASCLMGTAIANDGKNAILAAGIRPILTLLAPEASSAGQLYASKTLASIASHPDGRAALLEIPFATAMLKALAEGSKNSAVARAAKVTYDAVL